MASGTGDGTGIDMEDVPNGYIFYKCWEYGVQLLESNLTR